MKYFIVSHGDYAHELLKSAEMIVGENKNICSIAFKEGESPEDLYQKIKNAIKKLCSTEKSDYAILVDIFGGTPYNVSLKIYEEDDNAKALLHGISLQILLPLAVGEKISGKFKAKDFIGYQLKTDDTSNEIKKVEDHGNQNNKSASTDNGIIAIRIDERLVHGQVATAWIGSLSATRVMIIDDQVVESDIEKKALRSVTPNHVNLSILTKDNAAKRINEGMYSGERVLIIVKTPDIILDLFENNVSISQVNLGNMSKTPNRSRLEKSTYVSEEELNTLVFLANQGIDVYYQMVPGSERKTIDNYTKGV